MVEQQATGDLYLARDGLDSPSRVEMHAATVSPHTPVLNTEMLLVSCSLGS